MRVVTGEAKGRKLKSPNLPGTRPIMDRVKTALFDIISSEVPDARFLDLFAGTGGVGIEALSRGARQATFIEMNHKILKLVRDNLQITQLADRAETLHSDAFKFLQAYQKPAEPTRDIESETISKSNESEPPKKSQHPVPERIIKGTRQYDIIYIAPPQYAELAARALALTDSSTLLAEDGLVIVQIHPKERPGVAAIKCLNLTLTDERRYGSTLLMFYRPSSSP